MSDRDDLAMELFIADNRNQPREVSIQDWAWFRAAGKDVRQVDHYLVMADGALAAGYVKVQP